MKINIFLIFFFVFGPMIHLRMQCSICTIFAITCSRAVPSKRKTKLIRIYEVGLTVNLCRTLKNAPFFETPKINVDGQNFHFSNNTIIYIVYIFFIGILYIYFHYTSYRVVKLFLVFFIYFFFGVYRETI